MRNIHRGWLVALLLFVTTAHSQQAEPTTLTGVDSYPAGIEPAGIYPAGVDPESTDSTAINLARAEALIDAFYAFDRTLLEQLLLHAPSSRPYLLYYQGWAQGGHYRIVSRAPCSRQGDLQVRCAITVADDLIQALQVNLYVTDVFTISFNAGEISAVSTDSNDPPVFYQAQAWVQTNRAAELQAACEGFFAGGETPGDCARTMVAGFKAYRAASVSGQQP